MRPLFVAVTFVFLALAGAASAGTITVGDNANGRTERLRRGDVLVVALHGNLSTGYSWEVESVDSRSLHRLRTQYVYPHKPGFVGGYDITRFRFRARAAGRATIRLVYARFGRGPVTRRFRLVVLVR